MKKKAALRFLSAAAAVAALPFAVTKAVTDPPDVNKLLNAAVDFTAAGLVVTEKIDFGNDNIVLYKPVPSAEEHDADREMTAENTQPPLAASENTAENNAENETEAASPENQEPPSSEQGGEYAPTSESMEEKYIITQNISCDSEDLSVFNGRDLRVEEMTYKPNGGSNFIDLPAGGQVRNCTELDNSFVKEQSAVGSDISVELYSESPQVLIMHTHACESYLTGEGTYQDETYTCRTTDSTQSVVAVGRKIAEKLAEKGICVLHDGTLHDYPLYNGSYDRAEETITSLLEKYPSIKVVLDVHRDGIVERDGTPVAAVTEINGKKAAQVMIISAASDGYYHVPNYLENFHFACRLQQQMEADNAGITRPVLFEYCQYNQHLTTGSLLLEIGSQGNTLEQALYTGELIGDSIAEALL
ncbi:MAG: stage II sporulation protein P [[Eubacterium] siraeum]|nr:stage II sporulation protein P [[Eubacterium] siraeum]